MDFVKSWIEKSPYTAFLGVELEAISEEAATLALPYKDENSNPGKALHGGCAASLGAVGGQAVARAALAISIGSTPSPAISPSGAARSSSMGGAPTDRFRVRTSR